MLPCHGFSSSGENKRLECYNIKFEVTCISAHCQILPWTSKDYHGLNFLQGIEQRTSSLLYTSISVNKLEASDGRFPTFHIWIGKRVVKALSYKPEGREFDTQ
jgi:hypothetical protein